MTFREQLREILKDLGITQKEAAVYIGVPYRTFQNWILGTAAPAEYIQLIVITQFNDYKRTLR